MCPTVDVVETGVGAASFSMIRGNHIQLSVLGHLKTQQQLIIMELIQTIIIIRF